MVFKRGFWELITIISIHLGNFFVSSVITDVRLFGGPSPGRGTVGIELGGDLWVRICGMHLSFYDVIVICRQLGFRGFGRPITKTPYLGLEISSPSEGLNCYGDEADLSECTLFPAVFCESAGAAICYGDGYLGCFEDNAVDRVLPGDNIIDEPDMTISFCIQFCNNSANASYVYAGVENRNECFCGEASDDYTRHGVGTDADCQASCSGDYSERCGGLGYIAVYSIVEHASTTATSSVAPTTPYVTASASKMHVNTGQPSTNTIQQEVSSFVTTAYPSQKNDCSKDQTTALAVGIFLAFVTLYGIIMTIMYLHTRRSNVVLKQSKDVKLGQELDPYTSLDVSSMQRPAYEDIKSATDKNTPDERANAVKKVTYENQKVAEQTARVNMVKKFTCEVTDNVEPEYELPIEN